MTDSKPTPRAVDPQLERLLKDFEGALVAGQPPDAVEREAAERFGDEALKIAAAIKARHVRSARTIPTAQPMKGPDPKAETWTMSGGVTWVGPSGEGTGARFGRFELLGRIGAGGSGVVFRARDPHLGRLVALKVARAEVLFSREAKQRFIREARVLAALRHANIIPVYEAGETDGLPYLVEELCEGPNLASWLGHQCEAGQAVPIRIAVNWALLMAEAVAHAHDCGIVHRDLKPANVLLEPSAKSGEEPDKYLSAELYVPRISDFGIAKLFNSDDEVTATHAVLGTAAYMAPEQAEGRTRDVGAPADVYSLGVMLYELLTGRRPIEGRTEIDTLRRLGIEEPKPLAKIRGDIPRDLAAICLKCLEKEPARRYLTARDLGLDLRRFLAGEPVAARPVGLLRRVAKAYRRQRRLVLAGAAALTLVLLAGIFMFEWGQKESVKADTDALYTHDIRDAFNLWYENAERLRDNPHAGEEMATLLARHIPQAGEVDRRRFDWHYLWRLCHPAKAVGPLSQIASLMGHKGDVYYITFSRDGSRIASAGHDRTARVWNLESGRQVCVCTGHHDDVNWVDFSPDQSLLATASDDHTVKVWDAATGKERFTLNGHEADVVGVLFDSSGKLLVSGDSKGMLNLWDLATKKLLKSVSAHSNRIQALAMSSDGRLLATAGDDQIIRLWKMPDLNPNGMQRTDAVHAATFSPDGETLAGGGNGTVSMYDVRTGGLRSTFSYHSEHIESLRFDPNGRQLASCAGDGTVRIWDIPTRQGWMAVPARTQATLSGDRAGVGMWCVAYSPDGRRLATSSRDGRVDVWDNSVTPQWTLVTNSQTAQNLAGMSFSPDGARLALAYPPKGSGGFRIWDVSSLRPSLLHDVHKVDADCVCFSRDGRELATASATKIEIFDVETAARQLEINLAAGRHHLGFGFDGRDPLLVIDGEGEKGKRTLSDYHVANGIARKGAERHLVCLEVISTGRFADGGGKYRAVIRTTNSTVQFAVYDCKTGDLRLEPFGGVNNYQHAAIASSAPLVALGRPEGIELWDVARGRELGFLPGMSQSKGPLVLSADGRLLLALSREQRTVHIWDTRLMKQLFTLPFPHELATRAVDWVLAMSPDGRKVACSARDVEGNGGVYLYAGLPANAP